VKHLIKIINDLLESGTIEKREDAYENLLILGKKISESKGWKIKGKEVETFLRKRNNVM